MSNWWEIQQAGGGEPQLAVWAIAYYRHSAQDRQENSIPFQRDQVWERAAKNGVHNVKEVACWVHTRRYWWNAQDLDQDRVNGKRPAEAGVVRLDCRGDSGLASSERPRCGAVILPCGPRRCPPDAPRPSDPAVNSAAARFPVQGLAVIAAELAKAS